MRVKLRKICLYRFFLCIFLSAALAGTCYVHVLAAEAKSNTQRVYDEADILTQEEYDLLEDMCLTYGKDAQVEIFILIHNDPDAVYPEKFIEDFEDLLPVGDRVYFLLDMARGERGEIFMEGYGKAETYIHSKRIDKIFDNVTDDLRAGNYYDAFETYIIMSAEYMTDNSELNYDHNYSYDSPPSGSGSDADYDYDRYYNDTELEPADILTNIWFQLAVSLAVGGIAVGIMAYNSGGRMTARGNDYLDMQHSGLVGRRDDYIRTRVTRIRKPQNNNTGRGGFNAGGFRGGISSGGRSHSSGGRRL